MNDEKVMKIYELGYHLAPLMGDDAVPVEVGNLKGLIESKGGLFVSEEFPKLRTLAYELSKVIDGRKHDFNQAYFGWLKFEIEPEALADLRKSLDTNPNVLRYLFVETVRENTMSFVKPAYRKEDGEKAPEQPEKTEITQEDEERISKSIDELVKE